MEKELKIVAPDGYEIDKEKSSLERIVFKKKESKLPESWEEFCDRTKRKGFFITATCDTQPISPAIGLLNPSCDRNILESANDCGAHLALMQLHRLRDCYRQGWDETMHDCMGWVVYVDYRNNLDRVGCSYGRGFLSFQNKEMETSSLRTSKI